MADADGRIGLLKQPTATRNSAWSDFLQISKLRLNLMVLVTALAGYLLASGSLENVAVVVNLLMGVVLAGVGASALNQYLEREADRTMERTADRPLPAGRMTDGQALAFGLTTLILGILQISLFVNLLAGFLCVLTAVSYLFVYTPLKRSSPICTLVGAIPGALPPLIGWSAAQGRLTAGAWVLFAIMFTWQLPHFFSIAWLYRRDYERAGQPMISVYDETGLKTAQHMVMSTLNLLFVTLVPTALGLAGFTYLVSAAVLGLCFLTLTIRFCIDRTNARARGVLFASLAYLPLVLLLWLLDKT